MDKWISALDGSLRTLFASAHADRPTPVSSSDTAAPALDAPQKQLSAALMRVNHTGEICAQALYTAQAAATANPRLRAHFLQAAREETDHLAWTETRLQELGSHTSRLNPLWYAGAFGLGLLAGKIGDAISLGFVVETERQVEAHLQSHLDRLPAADQRSRAIVAQMKTDEAEHAAQALEAGAAELPTPVKNLMRAAAKVMTTTAHYV
jgi:ubiquinone biosynthesis monooxygenase Coq7